MADQEKVIDRVKIKISTKHDYDLEQFFIDFDKSVNKSTGRPGSATELTICRVTFSIPVYVNLQELLQWEYQQNLKKDISIDFYSEGELQYSYELKNTYLLSFERNIQKTTGGWMQFLALDMSPLSIKMDEEIFNQ